MKLNRTYTRKEAFSLIELLAVIAIIGILFTLVSPQIGKARLKGKLTQQAHHAKSIVEAIVAYESGSRFSTVLDLVSKRQLGVLELGDEGHAVVVMGER